MPTATVLGTVRAMACDVTVHGPPDGAPDGSGADVADALAVFGDVHRTCTRFDPSSPLMEVNARPDRWHRVPPVLFTAVAEAHRAYVRTRGRFDPRVLDDLRRLGYDRSLPFAEGPVATIGRDLTRRPLGRWRPRFRGGPRPELHLGGTPVELGGIGKGLAVRWAAGRLAPHLDAFLLDAGGDCHCRGGGPDGGGWQVGVEDPAGAERPVAVLTLRDRACATSSTRLRRWTAGGAPAHHLIDPRTGRPGGDGLTAVTVVAGDAVEAEVATKDLFLRGRAGIAAAARARRTAALWIGSDGSVTVSEAMAPYLVWRAP